jgi:hypothetical protein
MRSGRDTVSALAVNVEPLAVDVSCTDDALRVVLADGREIAVPLVWFPRLLNATPEQRKQWRLIGGEPEGKVEAFGRKIDSPGMSIHSPRVNFRAPGAKLNSPRVNLLTGRVSA